MAQQVTSFLRRLQLFVKPTSGKNETDPDSIRKRLTVGRAIIFRILTLLLFIQAGTGCSAEVVTEKDEQMTPFSVGRFEFNADKDLQLHHRDQSQYNVTMMTLPYADLTFLKLWEVHLDHLKKAHKTIKSHSDSWFTM